MARFNITGLSFILRIEQRAKATVSRIQIPKVTLAFTTTFFAMCCCTASGNVLAAVTLLSGDGSACLKRKISLDTWIIKNMFIISKTHMQ